jgi:flagellar export protein FliJ
LKQFRFRLDRVQRLRERLREQRRLQFAEALSYQQQVEQQITQVQELRGVEMLSLREVVAQTAVPIDTVIQSRIYDNRLGNHAVFLGRQLDQVRQVVAMRQTNLVAAERDVRILERLEAKLRHRYQRMLDRAEIELMDELGARAARSCA